jgi:deoxyribonuclease V
MELINLERISDPEYKPLYQEALAIQRELQKRVKTENGFREINRIAGVDLAQIRGGEQLICGILVYSFPELIEIERSFAIVRVVFPYIPGLLAFREGPAIIETVKQLKTKPDVLMVDGQGIAHPRGCGIASHVGVILDIPSIGVAKKRLYGKFEEPEEVRGDWTELSTHSGKSLGAALRTKDKTRPVFVSIGHKIDLKTSINVTLQCASGFRIPEPTRQADIFVAELKKKIQDGVKNLENQLP